MRLLLLVLTIQSSPVFADAGHEHASASVDTTSVSAPTTSASPDLPALASSPSTRFDAPAQRSSPFSSEPATNSQAPALGGAPTDACILLCKGNPNLCGECVRKVTLEARREQQSDDALLLLLPLLLSSDSDAGESVPASATESNEFGGFGGADPFTSTAGPAASAGHAH